MRVAIWPEQMKIDFAPDAGTPDFVAVLTEEFLKDPTPLVSSLQSTFDNPQHFRITAHRVA